MKPTPNDKIILAAAYVKLPKEAREEIGANVYVLGEDWKGWNPFIGEHNAKMMAFHLTNLFMGL